MFLKNKMIEPLFLPQSKRVFSFIYVNYQIRADFNMQRDCLANLFYSLIFMPEYYLSV